MWSSAQKSSSVTSQASLPERLVVWLTSFPSSAPILQPATTSAYTIISVHSRDDTAQNMSHVLDFTFRYDDALDAEKLRGALARLLEMGGWRKLGGRLRLDKHGKLEYHLPSLYTEERPAFLFSHIHHENTIDEDVLSSQLPKMKTAAKIQSIHPDPLRFNSLARNPQTPLKLNDYTCSDMPQLALHIVSFTDATLVTVTWCYTLSDAMGITAIFDAWILVLEGKEDEVPPFTGFDTDPLSTFGSPDPTVPCEPLLLAKEHCKGIHFFLYGLRYLYEMYFSPDEEDCVVCNPAATIKTLRNKAIQSLTTPTNSAPFLSEGDVLCAWWTHTVLRQMPWSWNRNIVILNLFCL